MSVKLLKNKSFNIQGKTDSIYQTTVTKFGNGAKIDCLKGLVGRDVIVLVLKNGEKI